MAEFFQYGVGPGRFLGVGAVGMLVMALLWVGLLVLLIWGLGRLFPRERKAASDVAREVVERRYAAGQITEAEYLQALRTLGADRLDQRAEKIQREGARAEKVSAREEVRQ